MELRIQRKQFLAELSLMLDIVERRSKTIPILSHVLLSVREDRLHLAATDLDVSLASWCEAEVKSEGAIAVQAKKLIEIIRALSADEVLLSQAEPRVLSIRAGSSRFKVHGLAADDFPTLATVEDGTPVQIPFLELKRMIGMVLFAVSADESRFQLNGALLKLKDGSFEMVATDGHRLALIEKELARTGEVDSVLVPRKALQELQRFEGEGSIAFHRGENHLLFSLGRRELVCRILEGSFPDYERVIARDNDKHVLCDRRLLAQAAKRAALMTGDRARTVRLQLTPAEMVITAVNADLGEAVEGVVCEYDGPELRLGINPDYLSDFLSAVDTERVRLELKDENSQCVGYPVEGSDTRYLCVIMPMRL